MCGCNRAKNKAPSAFDEPIKKATPVVVMKQSVELPQQACDCCKTCSLTECINDRQVYATASEVLIGVGAVMSLTSYVLQLNRTLHSKKTRKATPLSRKFLIVFLIGELFYIIGAGVQIYGTNGTGWVLLVSNILFTIVMAVTLITVVRNRHDSKKT
jgi:hypothetical protein